MSEVENKPRPANREFPNCYAPEEIPVSMEVVAREEKFGNVRVF